MSDLHHASGKIGTYRALVIGINIYKDPRIPDLTTAVNDAKAMAELLRDRYGFKVDMLLNGQATKKSVYNALRNLASRSKSDDSVLIYYAGHGDRDRQYNDGWWIPSDATGGDPVSYLDNVQVQKAMRSMKARHVLLISDSCYSGTLFGQARSVPPVINDRYYLNLYNEKSRWGMTSGNKTPVADDGTGGHSVFAYQLLKELRNNEKPFVTTQEIYTRIAPIIANNSEQTPLCRPVRNTGDQGGEFVFIASSGAVVEKPAVAPETATLSVESNVSDAKVHIDNRYVGLTDLSGLSVKPGEHRIRVEKEGYETYSKAVRFRSGRSQSLSVYLEVEGTQMGSLSVDTVPEDARVRVLNIAPKFHQGMELAPGRYHVEVSGSGYATKRNWISLAAGEDKRIDVRLRRDAVAVPTPAEGRKVSNSLGMEFVYIQPGTFMMGSPSSEADRENDERQHRVTLTKGFYMQMTEVTQGQWRAVMGTNPSHFNSCGNDCPVEKVSWNDIQDFLRKLNQRESGNKYRLPTEAEWEYAARAGTTTRFSFGDSERDLGSYAWYWSNSGSKTHAVGQKLPNPWGLYDMHGNVWEWCQDWEGDYPSGSVTDPKGPSRGSDRVIRGGSWSDAPSRVRSANQFRRSPGGRRYSIGFRLLRTE